MKSNSVSLFYTCQKLGKRRAIISIAVILCIVLIAVFILTRERTLRVDWSMHCHLVHSDSTTIDSIPLLVSGKINDSKDGASELNLHFSFPDNFPYIIQDEGFIVPSWANAKFPYYVFNGFCLNRDNSSILRVTIAIDVNEKLAVFLWNDNRDSVLVASTSEIIDADQILSHFQQFLDLYNDDSPSTSSVPGDTQVHDTATHSLDTNMHAAIISADGNVVEEFIITLQAEIYEHDTDRDTIHIEVKPLSDFRYTLGTFKDTAYLDHEIAGLPYYCGQTFGLDKVEGFSVPAAYALDADAAYLIIQWQSYPNYYLVASADSSVSPVEIMEHFEQFLALYSYSDPNNAG